jgi:two-component system response regulator
VISVHDLVTILLVEDNPDDATLTELALRQGISVKLEIARDGQEALDYLSNEANDLPRLVLLDLRLPSVNGLEVLRRMREYDRTRLIPVVTVTNSAAASDVAAAYRYGTNSYIRKPVDFDRFAELIRLIGLYWLVANEPPPDARDL